MKRILSIILALAMIVTSIVIYPTIVKASEIEKSRAKEVTIGKTKTFNEKANQNNEDYFLYKVKAEDEGVYVFECTGGSGVVSQYLYEDGEDDVVNMYETIKSNNGSESSRIQYKLKKGEVVYFQTYQYNYYDSGEFEINIRYGTEYIEKDNVIYMYDEEDDVYSVEFASNFKIKEATISATINGKKVEKIKYEAFAYCNDLSKITIPEGIKEIGDYAFGYTALEEIKIPESCIRLGYDILYGTYITEMHIPKNVEEIDSLYYMPGLKKITVSSDNQEYTAVDGVLYSKDMKTMIKYPIMKEDTSFNVPNGVKIISYYAFSNNSNLKTLIISDSVETIENSAFSFTSIVEVKIGKNVENIDSGAFEYCTNLKYIEIPESVEKLESYIFYGCGDIDVVVRNRNCQISHNFVGGNEDTHCTLYGYEGSTVDGYQGNNTNVVLLNPNGCNEDTPEHQMTGVYKVVPTCEKDGVMKHFCINCGKEGEDTTASKTGHYTSYSNHWCTVCKTVINKDSIKYVELDKDNLVVGKDFEGNTGFALYGFKPGKAGKYKIAYENRLLKYTSYLMAEDSKGDIEYIGYDIDDDAIYIEEGETLWIGVDISRTGLLSAGYHFKVTCAHSKTKIKTTSATCEKDGKKEEICECCGKTVESAVIPKINHSYGKNHKCSICGKAETITVGSDTYNLDNNNEYVSNTAKKSSIVKLTKGKKSFKIKWKKVTGAKGYQVQYSTSKKFAKKGTVTKTYSGNKKFTKTIKKLKSKKTYYVRVRAYKTKKVNGKTIKLYSGWSKSKSIKTK